MADDISRNTFDPTKHHQGVRLQQGRVWVDADFNEQVDIVNHRLEQTLADLVGHSGAPAHGGGFAIEAQNVLEFDGHAAAFVPAHADFRFADSAFMVELRCAPDEGRGGGTLLSANDSEGKSELSLALDADGSVIVHRHGTRLLAAPARWKMTRTLRVIFDGQELRVLLDDEHIGNAHAPVAPHHQHHHHHHRHPAEASPVGVLLGMGLVDGERRHGFHGVIEAVRIWAGSDETAPLIAGWDLDEGTGTLAADRSGRGHHLQLDYGHARARPRWNNRSLTISPGRFYVEGLMCTAPERRSLVTSGVGSTEPAARNGVSLVYLDAWERIVSAFEDPSLSDPALGGVDTATRIRLEHRVRSLWISPDVWLEPDSEPVRHAWQRHRRAQSQSGSMRVQNSEPANVRDGYYRVEIHHSGGHLEASDAAHSMQPARATAAGGRELELLEPGASRWQAGQWCGHADWTARVVSASEDGTRLVVSEPVPLDWGTREFSLRPLATFKWSRNNASEKWRVHHAQGTGVVLLETPGRRRLAAGDLIELGDERQRQAGEPGFVSSVVRASDDGLRVTLRDAVPALGDRIVLVRWHGHSLAPVSAKSWTTLEHGIRVQFGGRASYRSGEGWGFAAREVDGSVDWPLAEPDPHQAPSSGAAAEPAWRSPHDGHHHYAPLALLARQETGVSVRDLRRVFSPLARATEVLEPQLVETISHVGRETQIDDGVIRSRQLASDVGVVPPGAFILGEQSQPPSGFAATGAALLIPEREPRWQPRPHQPLALASRVALVAVPDGVVALVQGGRVWHSRDGDDGWRAIAEMPDELEDFAAAARGDGIHVVGGRERGGVPLARHWLLDRGQWQPRAPLRVARAGLSLAVIDGTLLAAGGTRSAFFSWRLRDVLQKLGLSPWWYPEHTTNSVERYDDARDRWVPAPALPVACAGAGSDVSDGRWHVLGGRSVPLLGKAHLLRDHQEFSLALGRWTTRPPLRLARALPGVTSLGAVLYIAGGEDDDGPLASVERHAPGSDVGLLMPPLPERRSGAGLLARGEELVCIGGRGLPRDAAPVLRCVLARTLFVHRRLGAEDLAAGRRSRESLAAPASSVPPFAGTPGSGALPSVAAPPDAAAPAPAAVRPAPTLAMPSAPRAPSVAAPPAAPPVLALATPAAAAPAAAPPSAPAASAPASVPASAPASAPAASAPPSSLSGVAAPPPPSSRHELKLPSTASKPSASGLGGQLSALGKKAKQALPLVLVSAAAGLVGSGNMTHVLDSARQQLITWLTPAGSAPTASAPGAGGAAPGAAGAAGVPSSSPSGAVAPGAVAPGQTAPAAVPAGSTLPAPLYLGDTTAPYARGVDVSHYQADVPWQTLADNGVVYAFAKATEGTTYRDPRFSANWSAMKAHGLLRGAYHMWHPDDDPVTQAKFFASVVGTGSDLPPVIDVELVPTQTDCPALLASILTFMQTVEQQLGSISALYTYRKYWVEHLTCASNASASAITQSLAQRPLWVADYSRTDAPELFGGRSNWAFWQYTDQGDAAADHLDLDRFAGTPQTLRTWLDDLKSLSAWQQSNTKR